MSTTHERAEAVVQELFRTTEGRRDPYPRYHRLRELAPVHRSELGMWIVSSYGGCSAMLRDPRFGKNFARQMETLIGRDWREHPSVTRGEHSMLNVDGPAHTRIRRLVIDYFKRKPIDKMRPLIQETVDRLLDPYAEAGGGDFLDAVAFPLPVTVIGEMLGVPEADRAQFRYWIRDLTGIIELKPTAEQIAVADAAVAKIRGYFDGLIEEKRRRPGEDLLSVLVSARDEDRLSTDELATLASLLFGAGFETTTNLVGNGLWGFLQNPDQLEALRDDDTRYESLPDEVLRYDGTVQMVARYTSADVEIDGVTIPANESVMALIGAANHDPAEFHDPDRIDLRRPRFRPMSFGGGIHFCLGAQLARAEIEITFRSVLDRFGSIELDGAPPRFRDRLTLRGLETLNLVCRAEARSARPATRPSRSTIEVPIEATAVRPESRDASHVRPRPGDSEADAEWRNALRASVETAAAAADDAWIRTGADLAATIVLLARADLFRSCTPGEIAELASTAYPMSFEAGDALCVEGGESLECYVISEGEASVTIAGREVTTVAENDVVGERGPLEGRSRSATVIATNHVNSYAISRERLLALIEKSPKAAEGMYEYVKGRYDD